jgi:hypothetical protein
MFGFVTAYVANRMYLFVNQTFTNLEQRLTGVVYFESIYIPY